LLEAESGWRNIKSHQIGANGYSDYGECQLNRMYHKPFIDSVNFKDWRKRLDYCYKTYKGGAKFYGLKNIHKVKSNFIF
jgi:hypothetical protein